MPSFAAASVISRSFKSWKVHNIHLYLSLGNVLAEHAWLVEESHSVMLGLTVREACPGHGDETNSVPRSSSAYRFVKQKNDAIHAIEESHNWKAAPGGGDDGKDGGKGGRKERGALLRNVISVLAVT